MKAQIADPAGRNSRTPTRMAIVELRPIALMSGPLPANGGTNAYSDVSTAPTSRYQAQRLCRAGARRRERITGQSFSASGSRGGHVSGGRTHGAAWAGRDAS